MAGIFAVAIAVRGWHLIDIAGTPFSTVLLGDGFVYDQWARNIMAGNWVGEEVFYQAPLYPYFLAVVYAVFGDSVMTARVVQCLLGSIACVILARAGFLLFGQATGIISGFILALYAPAIFFDGLIQKAALDGPLTALVIWIIAASIVSLRPWRFACLGVVTGLWVLSRENALILIGALLPWTLLARSGGWKRRISLSGLFVAGVLIVLMPVALRNYLVGGEFHLTTSQFGPNFYIGNNEEASGTYRALRYGRGDALYERHDARELAEEHVGRAMTPGEVSRYWTKQALDDIVASPGAWISLMARKFALFWDATELADTDDLYTWSDESTPLRWFGRVFHMGVLAPLAVLGMLLCVQQARRIWVLYAIVIVYMSGVVLFFVFARYRYPIVPFLVLFASAGGARAVGLMLRQPGVELVRRGIVAASLALSVGMAVLSNWPLRIAARQPMRAVNSYNIGTTLAAQGEYAEGADYLRQSLDAAQGGPPSAGAHANLAGVYVRVNQPQQAIQHYRAAAQMMGLIPEAADIHAMLGRLLAQDRLDDAALGHLRLAAQLQSDRPDLAFSYGLALVDAERIEAGLGVLRATAERFADNPNALNNIAWCLATHPDSRVRNGGEAVMYAERAMATAGEPTAAMLDTHAASLAAAGRFQDAVATATQALTLATAVEDVDQAESIRRRLALYERRLPYLSPPEW